MRRNLLVGLLLLLVLCGTIPLLKVIIWQSGLNAPSGPIAKTATEIDPRLSQPIGPSDLTLEQQKASSQRIQAGLPVETNLHKAVMDRVAAENLETLISHVEDQWGALEGSGIPDNLSPTSHAYISRSLRGNVRIKKIIEWGRKDGDLISALVIKEFEKRIAGWRTVLHDYDVASSQGASGFGTSTSGEIIGDIRMKAMSDSRMAIPGYAFILANLNRKETLKNLSSLIKQIDIVQFPSKTGFRQKSGYQELDVETIFFTAALLLQNHPEEVRYEAALQALTTVVKDESVAMEVEVPSSGSLWNDQELAVQTGRINISAEPKMKLWVPNEKTLQKLSLNMKLNILQSLAAADGELPKEVDPFRKR